MRRVLQLTAVGLIAYLLALLVELPAAWVYARSDTRVAPLRLAAIEGTLWNGRAGETRVGPHDLGRLQWRFDPQALLGARLGVALEADGSDLAATGRVALAADGGLEISALAGDAAAKLLGLVPSLGYAQPGGRLELDLARLALDGMLPVAADGKVVWRDSRIERPLPVALGDLDFTLASDDQRIRVTITDQGGPFAIDGTLELARDGALSIRTRLTPRPDADPGVTNTLRSLGRTLPDGGIEINYSDRLQQAAGADAG